jgi:integrase
MNVQTFWFCWVGHTIMRFISFLSFQGLLSRTVANYVAGVRAWALYLGYPETPIFTFRVKNSLKGMDRFDPLPIQATPITYQVLEAIAGLLPLSYDNLLILLAFSLLFFGCMRASEVCPPKDTPLRRSDFKISLFPICLSLEVPVSKTSPHGFVAAIGCSGARVCAPCLAHSIFNKYPMHQHHPVFTLSTGQLLTYSVLNRTLKRLVALLGLDSTLYSTHSFRSGAATAAAAAGLSDAEVQRLGRWRSSVFARYVRPSNQRIAGFAPALVISSSHQHTNN